MHRLALLRPISKFSYLRIYCMNIWNMKHEPYDNLVINIIQYYKYSFLYHSFMERKCVANYLLISFNGKKKKKKCISECFEWLTLDCRNHDFLIVVDNNDRSSSGSLRSTRQHLSSWSHWMNFIEFFIPFLKRFLFFIFTARKSAILIGKMIVYGRCWWIFTLSTRFYYLNALLNCTTNQINQTHRRLLNTNRTFVCVIGTRDVHTTTNISN